MSGLRRLLVLSTGAWLAGCAGVPAQAPASDPAATEAAWGDEYDGLLLDTDRRDADLETARPSFAADVLDADPGDADVVVRARASLRAFAARYRRAGTGEAGALEWNARRAGMVVGAVRPLLAEGAMLADARDAAGVEPRGARHTGGLRLAASSSRWGSSPGAGVRVAAGRLRFALGAWRTWLHDDAVTAWASTEVRRDHSVAGIAVGGSSRPESRAWSVFAARAGPGGFVSGEFGVAPDGPRAIARFVGGEGDGWRAVFVAGAPSPGDDPSPAVNSRRWGTGVERRATLGRINARTMLSTRSRRHAARFERRQRVETLVTAAVAEGARIETAVRATREAVAVAPGVLDAGSAMEVRDEVRARVILRSTGTIGAAVRAEQVYRVEVVVDDAGGARTGRAVAWTGRVAWSGVDVRVQASAFDLGPGQLAYAGRAVLPGGVAFAALSDSGIDLSASVRIRAGHGVSAGVQAARTASGEGRFAVQAGVVW